MNTKLPYTLFWRFILFFLFIIILIGCFKLFQNTEIISLGNLFTPTTPREKFVHWAERSDAINAAQLLQWDSIYQKTFQDTLLVQLPHREIIQLDTLIANSSQSWQLALEAGRQLHIDAEKLEGGLVFGELYRLPKDGFSSVRLLAAWDTTDYQIIYENKSVASENLLFLVQVAPDKIAKFDVNFVSHPILAFPVAGATMSDIGSVWGDPRDGGRRKHEGNDIFAARGTPLLAVTDGAVVSIRESERGGKTVWLRDREGRSFTYYYAHLDSQLVRVGQLVERGDTVGTVGNTGNAKYTPPHLHFGIYRRGAIDPFSFIRKRDKKPTPPAFKIEEVRNIKTIPRRGNHFLRFTPNRKADPIRQLKAGEKVEILGVSGRYYRVKTALEEKGYVNFD